MNKLKTAIEWFVLLGSAVLVGIGLYEYAVAGFGALAFNHVILKG